VLEGLRQRFERYINTATTAADAEGSETGFHLACATLLIEMAHADHDVHPTEENAIADALQRAFKLDAASTKALMDEAHAEVHAAVSLHDYTSVINARCTNEQKFHLVELLWQVAYADGALDRYEEHFVRKVADLIYVRHQEFIRAKLKAQPNENP
jgi:uncharacterized tellurite resistance protein B-like protein